MFGVQGVFGLQAKCSPTCNFVNLEKTSAEVVVRGFVAHLSVSLTYRNTTEKPLEVSYVCPVDAKAAVYSFEAKLEGRTITAHCLEKKKAQEAYVNAVKQGHTAILGSEDDISGDILHLSLGNLPKGEVAELKLKIVTELTVDTGGAVTFTLPTVFNPRYCPADQTPGPEYVPSGSGSQAFTNTIDYSLDVRGTVNGSYKIAKITSDSDPINVVIDDDETNATVTQDGGSKRDHDWSFKIYYQTVHKANVLQMSGDRSSKGVMKDDVLMLNFFPEIPIQGFSPHNELIFVIDRSGSMGGDRIQSAKRTLLLFLKSLPAGCRFNIVSFGSHFETLFNTSSERYTEQTLQKAIELQKSMDANMGGTEIMGALKHVYSQDLIPGYARQMIVLTDGAVWNLKQIFELVSRHADETRVFSVGIGDGASTALVHGLADAGKGRYEMVVHENQLQTKVMGLVASMLQETVRELKVECQTNPSQDLILIPKVPPVIFGGQHLILYARIPPKTEVKGIKISGTVGDNKISGEVGQENVKIVHDSNFSFHRLAAKAQLNQWEMDDFESKRDAMIDLSVSSNVVCKATSFVGIDQDQKIIEEQQNLGGELGSSLFNDPRNATQYSLNQRLKSFCPPTVFMDPNWQSLSSSGGSYCFGSSSNSSTTATFGSSSAASAKGFSFGSSSNSSTAATFGHANASNVRGFSFGSSSSSSSAAPGFFMTTPLMKMSSASSAFCFNVESKKKVRIPCQEEAEALTEEIEDQLLHVVSSQKFDGSWSLEEILKFVSAPEDKFKGLQLQLGLDDICFATIFALAILEFKFGDRKQEWQLVQIKGISFLQSKGIANNTEMIEKCKEKLKEIGF